MSRVTRNETIGKVEELVLRAVILATSLIHGTALVCCVGQLADRAIVSEYDPFSIERPLVHPRPTRGILVAITVIDCTFASKGKLAI